MADQAGKYMSSNLGAFGRRAVIICLTLFWGIGIARSQEWLRMDVSDPHRGKYIGFELDGKFLQAPPGMIDKIPKLVLNCREGRSGHFRGKLLDAVVDVGPSADPSKSQSEAGNEPASNKPDPGGYYVEFRLDDGETQTEHWDNLFNYQQVGFGSKELSAILWGQPSPKRENPAQPIKKFVISIQRYRTEKIVMQFDLPDPTKVSELCGCTYFKEK
jgi:hypothetical protein